ncbi:hypothetical protein [Stutzerimonas balearica]|uniref:hypothetical protein n=1 Tax=Stutzerimonas balearica TaxID=74829 RepID=UPI0022AEB14A|nr:hypothetical protein [Stutzerimonas balearica]MCZ4127682.1 hypothetical protein [Stutzerimonas balearica]
MGMQGVSINFSLAKDTLIEDVFCECLNWILDSPHTNIAQEELRQYVCGKEFSFVKGEEEVAYSWAEDEFGSSAHSLRYKKGDATLKWITDISFVKGDTDFWVTVKASQESASAASSYGEVKKPIIVIRLLNRFGGGLDGDLPVAIEPIYLKDSEVGVRLAKALINGESVNRLPVVYVSSSRIGHRLIPDRLARKLSGMAHVIVEPSHEFSGKVRALVNSRNVYGGAVGIYWPSGSVTLFRRDKLDAKEFENGIYDKVCAALLTLSPGKKCSWDEVGHIKNRNAIRKLKEDGDSAHELVGLYENELAEKEVAIKSLSQDVERLSAKIRYLESKSMVQGGLVLDKGDEDDFFDNEIMAVVIDALREYLGRSVYPNSRRAHILESLLSSNLVENNHEERINLIKGVMKGYKEMNKRIRSVFEQLGFELASDGKHWKITYQQDDRYSYVLPKTGSDHRGGLNAGADITNIVY